MAKRENPPSRFEPGWAGCYEAVGTSVRVLGSPEFPAQDEKSSTGNEQRYGTRLWDRCNRKLTREGTRLRAATLDIGLDH